MERTLLLVDDEENIVSALVRLLRRDGYRILRANGGQAGLDLLEQHEVGVIVSDQRMPEMSGVEFLSRVKDLYPSTVRMVLSGYTDLASVTDAINRGAIYKFLTKPWDDVQLRADIEEAFQRFEATRREEQLARQLAAQNEDMSVVNRALEARMEEKVHKLDHSRAVLRVAQEILEHLPMAVVGIGDDGIIALANKMAHELLGDGGRRPLIGEAAADSLPPGLVSQVLPDARQAAAARGVFDLPGGRRVRTCCYRMGKDSPSQGSVLVLDPAPDGNHCPRSEDSEPNDGRHGRD